jgi:hypothetical protein
MGGKAQVKKHVDAIVDLIASTIVDVKSNCMAVAINEIQIEIGEAKAVKFVNTTINQVADAALSCQQNATVQAGMQDIQKILKEKLDEILQNSKNMTQSKENSVSKAKFIERLTNSFTMPVIDGCVTNAINSYKFRIGETDAPVLFLNFNLEQFARSEIKKCLSTQNIKVGDIPLVDFLENELPQFEVALPEEEACPEVRETYQTAYIVGGSTAAIIVIMIAAFVILRR